MASWDPGIFDTPEEQVGCVPKQLWKKIFEWNSQQLKSNLYKSSLEASFFFYKGKVVKTKTAIQQSDGFSCQSLILISIRDPTQLSGTKRPSSRCCWFKRVWTVYLEVIQKKLKTKPSVSMLFVSVPLEILERFYITKITGCQLLWWPFHGEKTWIPNVIVQRNRQVSSMINHVHRKKTRKACQTPSGHLQSRCQKTGSSVKIQVLAAHHPKMNHCHFGLLFWANYNISPTWIFLK